MNDDQLQREIEAALSVEPSPQFAARVRTRIEESRRPSRPWIGWSLASAAGLAAAAIITLVFWQPQESGISKPAKTLASAELEAPGTTQQSTPRPPAVVHHAALPANAQARAREPEVLIDPREVAAFQKFVSEVQEKHIDLEKLIDLQQAAAKAEPIQEIALMPIGDLDPIVIESLTFGTRRIEGGSL